MPVNLSTVLYLFGGIERLYMFDYNAHRIIFERFQPVLNEMLEDLQSERFTIDQIVEFFSSIHILENLTLFQRYDYNISVSETDIAREEREEGEEEEEQYNF
jgi:hypothetical protein